MHDVTNHYNAIVGSVIAFFSMIFGTHWILFALFLLLNVADWLTGWLKSRLQHKESSAKGLQGILKKLGYWLMILVAFALSAGFIELGSVLNVDLGVTTLLGYFVLASLIVNEARSILENFVEAGYKVPSLLINGLSVAEKLINKESEEN